jgi:hypothetical protein
MSVIHIRNKRNTSDEVYIGRGSKWGNPFVIGASGDRETVIRRYKEYILKNDKLLNCLDELKGKTLVCYCKPRACHGDVLIELLGD